MTTAEFVTIGISSLALIISAITLYLTYFHKKAALVGCLAEFSTPEPDQFDNSVFDFALSNTGTRELLVRAATIEFSPPDGGVVPEIECAQIPTVLKPGEVRLFKLRIASLFLRNVAKAKQTVHVQFHVFSSDGTSYHPYKALAPQGEVIDVPATTWKPFTLGPAES